MNTIIHRKKIQKYKYNNFLNMLIRLAFRFCSKIPPPPQHPTIAGAFATKVDKKDLEKFMNPLGFLSNDELLAYKKEVEAETLKIQQSQEKEGVP